MGVDVAVSVSGLPAVIRNLTLAENLSEFDCVVLVSFQRIERASWVYQGLQDDSGLYLESDTDEQLLLHLIFQQGKNRSLDSHEFRSERWWFHLTSHKVCVVVVVPAVKIHSLHILGPEDGSGPKDVKLFINNPTLGFSEADEYPAVQDIELSKANLNGEPIILR